MQGSYEAMFFHIQAQGSRLNRTRLRLEQLAEAKGTVLPTVDERDLNWGACIGESFFGDVINW